MIKENLNKVRATVPNDVTLIAVSKTKPVTDLQEAYDAGQRIFGENKALEMRDIKSCLKIFNGISSVICRLTRLNTSLLL